MQAYSWSLAKGYTLSSSLGGRFNQQGATAKKGIEIIVSVVPEAG